MTTTWSDVVRARSAKVKVRVTSVTSLGTTGLRTMLEEEKLTGRRTASQLWK